MIDTQIKAIIFDFDGLIVDTETPALKAWQIIYERYGHNLDHQLWVDYFLGASFDPVIHLSQLCGGTLDKARAQSDRDQLKSELCMAQPLLPGVLDWIEEAQSLSLKLAVASSSRRPWVTQHLERCGILDRFDAICTREEVERSKPHPDLFLLAASKLNVDPADAIVLEDSPNGLRAALAAGMQCVVVPNALTEYIPFVEHQWRLCSLEEITLSEYLSKSTASAHR